MESVRLYGGECSITWRMLDYMEGSVGLPGDSPIREKLFNTCWRGGGGWCQKHLANDPETIHIKKSTPLLGHVEILNPSPSSYFIYTQIHFFFIKTAFLKHLLKMFASEAQKYSTPLIDKKQISPPLIFLTNPPTPSPTNIKWPLP